MRVLFLLFSSICWSANVSFTGLILLFMSFFNFLGTVNVVIDIIKTDIPSCFPRGTEPLLATRLRARLILVLGNYLFVN